MYISQEWGGFAVSFKRTLGRRFLEFFSQSFISRVTSPWLRRWDLAAVLWASRSRPPASADSPVEESEYFLRLQFNA